MRYGGLFAGLADRIDPASVVTDGLPDDYEGWLRHLFLASISKPFAPHHHEALRWAWDIGPERPRPLLLILPRGGGKSTLTELIAVALGAKGIRRYCVYCSATQTMADDRLAEVALHLESSAVSTYFPQMGTRRLGKFGDTKGWNRQRLVTAGGFTVDALGFEGKSIRGLKREGHRPDLIVVDDADTRHDSVEVTRKKMATLTESILPLGAPNAAVLGVQNLMIPDGIFGLLASGRSTALATRHIIGPIPAIRELKTTTWRRGEEIPRDVIDGAEVDMTPYRGTNTGEVNRTIITHGAPAWVGQDIAACQEEIDLVGLPAFLREQQHEVDEVEGALWKRDMILRAGAAPDLVRIVIGVDPASHHDDVGIVAVGIDFAGDLYVLEDATCRARLGVGYWGHKVCEVYERLEADLVAAEINFGGAMVEQTIRVGEGAVHVPVKMVSASRGKHIRAEPAVMAYVKGRVFHVGVFPALEAQMTRWVPGSGISPGNLDAFVWAMTELLNEEEIPERIVRAGPFPG